MGNAMTDCSNMLMNRDQKEKNKLSEGYFTIIRKIQENNYIINSNNVNNVVMCFDKKEFTTTITSTRRVLNVQNDIKIDWLQYLYYYLLKQIEKQREWAHPIFEAIKKELFIYENEFKSDFFYKEFDIITRPIPVTKAMEYLEQEDILYQEYRNKKRNTSISKHYGGSFYGQNVIQEIIPDDPTAEYKFLRQQIKQYVSTFSHQIKLPDHPINIVTLIFCEHFSQYIQATTAHLKGVEYEMTKEDYEEKIFNETKAITLQLQKIIIKLQIILKLFYSTTVDYSCFSEEKDELINLMTTCVFNQNCIYTAMFELYQLSEANLIQSLAKKFMQYKNIQPDELNINVKFRMNLSTLQYQKELLAKKKDSNSKDDVMIHSLEAKEIMKGIDEKMQCPSSVNSYTLKPIIGEDEIIPNLSSHEKKNDIIIDKKKDANNNSNSNDKDNKQLGNNIDKLKRLEKKKANLAQKGYNNAIKQFEFIKGAQTPFEKMMIISKISEKVTTAVDSFWKDMMNVISPEFLAIEVDTLMEIFIYLLIKSQMTELPIHMQMIKFFTTNTTKTSMIGYYYTTLDAALNYIETTESIQKNSLFD